jgi:hypothetical protein
VGAFGAVSWLEGGGHFDEVQSKTPETMMAHLQSRWNPQLFPRSCDQ